MTVAAVAVLVGFAVVAFALLRDDEPSDVVPVEHRPDPDREALRAEAALQAIEERRR